MLFATKHLFPIDSIPPIWAGIGKGPDKQGARLLLPTTKDSTFLWDGKSPWEARASPSLLSTED